MKILVADDDQVSAAILADRLETFGFEVTQVHDGGTAWEAIESGNFRLLILDWMMPVLDGMEIVRRVRETPSRAYIYIVLLTGRTEREDRLLALDGGADDFLPKPLDEGELIARLKAAERILKSEEALQEINAKLEHSRRSELRTGGYIQARLLQTPIPTRPPGWEVARINLASNEVTGDFFEYFTFDPGILDIVAADVMGKGIPAALTGAGIKTSLNRAFIELLAAHPDRQLPPPSEVLGHVHRAVSPELIELSTFLTLCYARFDRMQSKLTYVNCGHPRLIHWKAESDQTEILETTSLPIGFTEEAQYSEANVPLQPGDTVAIYSDGVTDLVLPEGTRWTMRGFHEWLAPRMCQPIVDTLEELRSIRQSAPGPVSARDDFSCLLVRYIGTPAIGDEIHRWTTAEDLGELRNVVRIAAEGCDLGFTRNEVGEILLAVQEAISNAVRHARPGHSGLPVRIKVRSTRGKLRIEISYPGIAFDPKFVPEPVLDGSQDGGFGVSIIRQCMDSVMYSSVSGHNQLVFEKCPANRT